MNLKLAPLSLLVALALIGSLLGISEARPRKRRQGLRAIRACLNIAGPVYRSVYGDNYGDQQALKLCRTHPPNPAQLRLSFEVYQSVYSPAYALETAVALARQSPLGKRAVFLREVYDVYASVYPAVYALEQAVKQTQRHSFAAWQCASWRFPTLARIYPRLYALESALDECSGNG